MEGMRDVEEYSSVRSCTKLISCPNNVIIAVSKCFDFSGFNFTMPRATVLRHKGKGKAKACIAPILPLEKEDLESTSI